MSVVAPIWVDRGRGFVSFVVKAGLFHYQWYLSFEDQGRCRTGSASSKKRADEALQEAIREALL